jgi:RimJ/RimL family protein N-acetyltransferase
MPLDLTGVDLTTETLHTDRLVLRPFRPDDADAVFRACGDAEVRRWISALPSPYTEADAAQWVGQVAPAERSQGRGLPVAIEAGGELVGSGGAHFVPGRLGPEIGYWIAPWARRQGYAAEAATALTGWAFAHGAPRVHLYTDVRNEASQGVAERAGFHREGVVRSALDYRDGSRADAVLFGRVAGD